MAGFAATISRLSASSDMTVPPHPIHFAAIDYESPGSDPSHRGGESAPHAFRTRACLVKFTWNGDMPYSGVEWGLAFQVRAICLHRERESAPQVPVEGMLVPGDFHGRWY